MQSMSLRTSSVPLVRETQRDPETHGLGSWKVSLRLAFDMEFKSLTFAERCIFICAFFKLLLLIFSTIQ